MFVFIFLYSCVLAWEGVLRVFFSVCMDMSNFMVCGVCASLFWGRCVCEGVGYCGLI